MASHIRVEADVQDGADVASGDVRAALSGLDVSQSSPVSPNAREVAAWVDAEEGVVTLTVEGRTGSFTKKSETALTDTLKNMDGVDATSVEVVDGGYESRASDEDEGGSDESGGSAETSIEGYGGDGGGGDDEE